MKQQSSVLRTALLWGCALVISLLPARGAILTNRYSFTGNANDSVGGKNGTLVNGGFVGGTAMRTTPAPIASGDDFGQYVALPSDIVSNFTAITIETWFTPTHDDLSGGSEWNRLWDFGNRNGAVGTASFWFRTGNSANGIRGDIFGPGGATALSTATILRSEEHTSELQSLRHLVCRLLLEKK